VVKSEAAAAKRWRDALNPDSISLPDRRVTDAFYASLATS